MAKSHHNTTFVALSIVFLVLSLPNFGMAVWALYDGTIHYPELAERWQAYEQVAQNYPQSYPQEWLSVASQNGWPTTVPEKYNEADIITQFVMMGFCGFTGVLFFATAAVFYLLLRRAEAKRRANQPGAA